MTVRAYQPWVGPEPAASHPDTALYAAKRAGRHRIVVHGLPTPFATSSFMGA